MTDCARATVWLIVLLLAAGGGAWADGAERTPPAPSCGTVPAPCCVPAPCPPAGTADEGEARRALTAELATMRRALEGLPPSVGGLAAAIDGLTTRLDRLEAARSGSEIDGGAVLGVLAALGGAWLGAWLANRMNARNRRTDLALDLRKRYDETWTRWRDLRSDFDARGAAVVLGDPVALNQLIELGNWWDTFATIYRRGLADRALVDALELPARGRDFRRYLDDAIAGHGPVAVPAFQTFQARRQHWTALQAL